MLVNFGESDPRTFAFPSDLDYKAIEAGTKYDNQAKALFARHGITATDICSAFEALLSVIAKKFDPNGGPSLILLCFEQCVLLQAPSKCSNWS